MDQGVGWELHGGGGVQQMDDPSLFHHYLAGCCIDEISLAPWAALISRYPSLGDHLRQGLCELDVLNGIPV